MKPLGDLIGDLADEKADPFTVAQKVKNLPLAFQQQRFVNQDESLFAEKPAEKIGSRLDLFEYALRNDDAARSSFSRYKSRRTAR
jgi:hypothetical protein